MLVVKGPQLSMLEVTKKREGPVRLEDRSPMSGVVWRGLVLKRVMHLKMRDRMCSLLIVSSIMR